jgi:hypothetical protein
MANNTLVDTTIYIGNFAIHEPVTSCTDILIALMCLRFFILLNRLPNTTPQKIYWQRFFGIFSLSTVAGACSHAFFAVHEGLGYKAFWLSMQTLNVFFVYSAQLATLNSALAHSANKKSWLLSYRIQLVLFTIAVFVFQNFGVPMTDIGIGFIPIMIIHFKDGKKNKESLWIAYGITILFLTGAVNISKLSFHKYFNHLDIAHVLIIVNLILMFVGIKRKAIFLQAA